MARWGLCDTAARSPPLALLALVLLLGQDKFIRSWQSAHVRFPLAAGLLALAWLPSSHRSDLRAPLRDSVPDTLLIILFCFLHSKNHNPNQSYLLVYCLPGMQAPGGRNLLFAALRTSPEPRTVPGTGWTRIN